MSRMRTQVCMRDLPVVGSYACTLLPLIHLGMTCSQPKLSLSHRACETGNMQLEECWGCKTSERPNSFPRGWTAQCQQGVKKAPRMGLSDSTLHQPPASRSLLLLLLPCRLDPSTWVDCRRMTVWLRHRLPNTTHQSTPVFFPPGGLRCSTPTYVVYRYFVSKHLDSALVSLLRLIADRTPTTAKD